MRAPELPGIRLKFGNDLIDQCVDHYVVMMMGCRYQVRCIARYRQAIFLRNPLRRTREHYGDGVLVAPGINPRSLESIHCILGFFQAVVDTLAPVSERVAA